ncbi:MAG: AMP-dependent synthetase and ligase [Pseudonocardiales bacterium]|nr:AMP-dependent synthetase and ligase [Pseudonocardiales bacterium]
MSLPVDLSLGETIEDNALRFADGVAYVFGDRHLTHRGLRDHAASLAAALADLGVRHQDRIAILSKNSIEFGEVLAAGQLSGIVVATVNFRLTPPEIERILIDSDPRVLLVSAEYVPLIEGLRQRLGHIETFVCLDDNAQPGYLPYAELIASDRDLPFTAAGADIACLIYTSGTTGRPKGCILGQREMRRLAHTMNYEMRSGSEDRILLSMPLFHIGAMAMAIGIHAGGGTAIVHRQFEAAAALASVRADRVNVLHVAPTMLQALVQEADSDPEALTGIQTVVYSAAPITTPVLVAAMKAMPDAGFLNLFGGTEVITCALSREFHRAGGSERDRRRLASVGHPFPDTVVRVIDENGRDCPIGAAGEIVVRSNSMFRGYWNDHVQTAEAIRDGWCHTGDMGRFDEEGLMHLVDRKKDMIISGGENVYSQEVEEALSQHELIARCAVIGVPDERWGEAVCAVVVAIPDSDLTEAEVERHARANLAGYKIPRRVLFVADLPVLATGKIDKKRLRAQYGGAQV